MEETKKVIKENGLVYITDTMPGIYRKGSRVNFIMKIRMATELQMKINYNE
ncbi:hypothetical protein [Pedobacter panaciterrae]